MDLNLTNISRHQVPWTRKYGPDGSKNSSEGHSKKTSGGLVKNSTDNKQNLSSESLSKKSANELDLGDEDLEEDRIIGHTPGVVNRAIPKIQSSPVSGSKINSKKNLTGNKGYEAEIVGRIHNELLAHFNLRAEITFTNRDLSRWKTFISIVDNQHSFGRHEDVLEMSILLLAYSIKHWEHLKLDNYQIGVHPGPGLFTGSWFGHLVARMIEDDCFGDLEALAISIICGCSKTLTLVAVYVEDSAHTDLLFLPKCFSKETNNSDYLNWNGNENEMKGGGVTIL